MELGLQAATDSSDTVASGVVNEHKEFRPVLKLKSKWLKKKISSNMLFVCLFVFGKFMPMKYFLFS